MCVYIHFQIWKFLEECHVLNRSSMSEGGTCACIGTWGAIMDPEVSLSELRE